MKVSDIVAPLEEVAPLFLQESYDNAGLLVGNPDVEINSALVCVDVTEAVLDEAVALGAGLIISHHPLMFHPLRHIVGATYIERAVATALRHDIAIYASHTNLDSAPGGMSFELGRLLELCDMELLDGGNHAMSGAGFGVVGNLQEPVPTMDFLCMVKERLGVGCVRYSNVVRNVTSRVALCTGAGASMMEDARRAGADVYVSSDFRYNNFLDADRDLVIADIGHFESEYCAIGLICEIIRKKIANFALYKSSQSVNPVNYLI